MLVDYRRVLLGNCTRFEGNKMLLHPDNAVPDGDEGGAKEETIDRSKPATILPNILAYSGNDQRR